MVLFERKEHRLRRATAFGILALLLVASGTSPAQAPSDASRIALANCTLPELTRAARCGAIEVAENPDKPNGRQIRIAVAVLPAASGHARADPILVLMGGPGESAIDAAGLYERWFRPLLRDRDLVLVDQRGAGRSGPLTCDLTPGGDAMPLLSDIFPANAIERCVMELRARADLTRYGYGNFADDLEAVRLALGYGTLNLFGGSYGTRALQVFLRRHPDSVRTAFLGSVVPIDIVAPETMATTVQVELDRLFTACGADARCRGRYPDLSTQFARIMDRLDRGQVQVTLPGQAGRHVLRRGPVAAWIRARLYRPSSAAELPYAIDRADRGDWQPIVRGVVASADAELSFGLFFAITCNEDMRFAAHPPVAASGFLGDYRLRQQAAACRFWPSSPLPVDYRAAVHSSVPVLFSTGGNDGGTPVWFTDHAAKGFTNAAILETPQQGHTEWNGCVADRYIALVRRGRISGPRRRICPPIPRPPFKVAAAEGSP